MEIRKYTEDPQKYQKIPRLPITFKTGSNGMCCSDVLLIQIVCKHCKTLFYMCRSCFRGHVYCSSECRNRAYANAHRKYQSKYRTSEKGKDAHRRYEQNRRRIGRCKNNEKTMADESIQATSSRVISYPILPDSKPRCSFCGVFGRVVKAFPR